MPKLTLENITPVRVFTVFETSGAKGVDIVGTHAQVREGTLEIFHTRGNITHLIELFAAGTWYRVSTTPLSASDVDALDALTQRMRDEHNPDIKKSKLEDIFSQLKH